MPVASTTGFPSYVPAHFTVQCCDKTKLGVFYFFLDSFLLVVFCIVLTTNIECEPVLEKGLRDCGLPSNENSRVITMRAPEYDWLCHLHSSYLFAPLFKQRVA